MQREVGRMAELLRQRHKCICQTDLGPGEVFDNCPNVNARLEGGLETATMNLPAGLRQCNEELGYAGKNAIENIQSGNIDVTSVTPEFVTVLVL